MKKNCLLFIMLIICGLFLGLSQQVCAANPPGFAVAFISEIGPTNIQTGDTVNGTLIIEASCYSGAVGGAVFFKPIINFGEAPPPSATAPDEQLEGGPCVCVNDSNDTSLKTVRCSYNFSHTYSRTGTFAVIPKTSYSSFGSSAVGSSGTAETIYVTETPTPTPHGNDINPLVATGIAELIRQLTDRIFIYFSGLAVLFVIMGGLTIMTAAGSPTRVMKGKKIVIFTIVGYALIILARAIAMLIVRILDINVVI